ncbi:MAG: phosphate transport system regulatory protein PhoU [Firmicutes bacterium HGW-Firmicutes-16]|nr:MAG: phosphate transport system regulatory protein PhoU [Firmicutes bacterium HGW-Firmicutes-16]
MATRKLYDDELKDLSSALIRMGTTAIDAVTRSMQALKTFDKALAKEIIEDDANINAMERDIETMCLKLILKQQPVATDLRKISTAIKMITDIERIGDAASDIAEISMYHDRVNFPDIQDEVLKMAESAKEMVASAIEAYVKGDLELAKATMIKDDVVDDYFLRIRHALGSKIYNDTRDMEIVIDYLMIVKYLERIGDHAVNICEWVHYYVTGIHINEELPDFNS